MSIDLFGQLPGTPPGPPGPPEFLESQWGGSDPCWRIVSLLDPDGEGRDLAFTDGLADAGLPELLLWARPTEGSDPGTDWLLTHRERGQLLNRWASQLLVGPVDVGEWQEERFDGGHSVARFRFDSVPEPAEALGHLELPRGVRVRTVAWSLSRRADPLEERPRPLRPEVARRMQRWVSGAGVAIAAEGPAATARTERPGRFGPMTAWVEARIQQVSCADASTIRGFLARLHLAQPFRSEDEELAQLAQLAARSHRGRACREATHRAQELAVAVAGTPDKPTPVWNHALAWMLHGQPPQLRLNMAEDFAGQLSDGLETLLIAAVVADLAPSWLLRSCSGPWEWALARGDVPGRLWLASPTIRRSVRDLLAEATPAGVRAAVEADLGVSDPGQTLALDLRVAGVQTVAAASARAGTLLRPDQRRGLPIAVRHRADELVARLLASMTSPRRLAPGDWELVRACLEPMAVDLPDHPPGWMIGLLP